MANQTTIDYNSLKYDISDLEYPNDLSSDNYGGHRVVFLINVADESKFRSPAGASSDVYDIPAGELRQNAGQRTADLIQDSAGLAERKAREQGLELNFRPTSFNKRLKAAISLYVPNDLTFSYGAQWGEEDLASSEQTLDVLNKTMDLNFTGAVGAGIRGMLSNFRRNAAVVNASQQTPGNSKVEQLFQGVDFRTFNFAYDFAPRSESEAKNVMNIISMFKHHMLPEYKDNDQFLFIFPSQFEIKYYIGDKENEYLDKHFTAVCTNCSINYTGAGQFSTFHDGMPTNIRMTLTFKELSVPTKETVSDKFGKMSYSDTRKSIAKQIEERQSNPVSRPRGGV